jgi:hypothetical protein
MWKAESARAQWEFMRQTARHVGSRRGHSAGQRTHAHGSGGDSSKTTRTRRSTTAGGVFLARRELYRPVWLRDWLERSPPRRLRELVSMLRLCGPCHLEPLTTHNALVPDCLARNNPHQLDSSEYGPGSSSSLQRWASPLLPSGTPTEKAGRRAISVAVVVPHTPRGPKDAGPD